jgi:hypothetical protein
MLSHWYKKQKARKMAPPLLRWAASMPVVGIVSTLLARAAAHNNGTFFSDDQRQFLVASLTLIAVPAFIYGGYAIFKVARLLREAQLSVLSLLRSEED